MEEIVKRIRELQRMRMNLTLRGASEWSIEWLSDAIAEHRSDLNELTAEQAA